MRESRQNGHRLNLLRLKIEWDGHLSLRPTRTLQVDDFVWVINLGALTGCSGGPTAVPVPPIDANIVADAALAKLDKNGDGELDKGELALAPHFAMR